MTRRLPLVLLALGGCDHVFGLERDVPPPVCGPFGAPEEVTFEAPLSGAHDLSVEPNGQRGMVMANAANAVMPGSAWLGPHAVKPGPAPNTWVQDTGRDRDILRSFSAAHVTPDGAAMAWFTGETHLVTFAGTAWSLTAETIDQPAGSDATIGNVIELPAGTVLKLKIAPQIVYAAGSQIGELRILQRIPTGTTWAPTEQAAPFAELKPPLDFTGAALTTDHEILVYSARVGTEQNARAYATRRTKDMFGPGVELIIDGVDQGSGITEPWINDDCTQLYFRNADKTWVTEAVSP